MVMLLSWLSRTVKVVFAQLSNVLFCPVVFVYVHVFRFMSEAVKFNVMFVVLENELFTGSSTFIVGDVVSIVIVLVCVEFLFDALSMTVTL